MSGFETEEVRDASAFAALEPEWWELWRRSPQATPFQSPAWLIPWWRHFAPGELFTIAVRREGRLVGLAPGYIEDSTVGRRILPIGISLSDYLDVLLDPDAPEAGAALVGHVAREGARWDAWELEELAPEAAAFGLPVPPGATKELREQSACLTLTLPSEARSVFDLVSRRKRKQIHLARNRADRRGAVSIEQSDGETIGPLVEQLVALHRARWERRGEAGLFADERVPHFQREAAPRLHEAGLLRLYALSIDDRIVAVLYVLTCRDQAYAYLTGFDPDYDFESPGVTLLAHAVDRAMAEGAHAFHLLRGQEPYKYEWGPVESRNRGRSFRRIAPHA